MANYLGCLTFWKPYTLQSIELDTLINISESDQRTEHLTCLVLVPAFHSPHSRKIKRGYTSKKQNKINNKKLLFFPSFFRYYTIRVQLFNILSLCVLTFLFSIKNSL